MFGLFKNFMSGGSDSATIKSSVQQGAKLVDVRTPSEFASGSVPNALNIPLDKLPKELHRLKKSDTIIVFCRSGNRSSQAKAFLEQQGYKTVLDGGTWTHVNRSL